MRKTPLLLAMMIIATGQVGVSIYLPSLPLIGHDLNLPQHTIQNLVTLFLVGFGVSQLIYGPLSDAIGRRPVFILGQSVYLVGTIICIAFADHIFALETGRLLQGLGAGSASVLGRSVLRDSYDGAQLTKAFVIHLGDCFCDADCCAFVWWMDCLSHQLACGFCLRSYLSYGDLYPWLYCAA